MEFLLALFGRDLKLLKKQGATEKPKE